MINTCNSMHLTEWQLTPLLDHIFKLIYIQTVQDSCMTFIGVNYHPLIPQYKPANILGHIEEVVVQINLKCPGSHIVLAGELNTL